MEANTDALDALSDVYLSAATLVGEDLLAAAEAEVGRTTYGIREDVMAATPVSKPAVEKATEPHLYYLDERPGQLRESTVITEQTRSLDAGSVALDIEATQERLAHANLDGSGGGYDVTKYVLEGRGAIEAPSFGPHATGKLALLTPWGPRRSVGSALPAASPSGVRPYIDAAYPAVVTATTLLAHRWGQRAAETFVARTSLEGRG